MPHPSHHTPLDAAPACRARPGLVGWAVFAIAALALVAAGALWAHFGTAVFFETIAAGIAACF